MVWTLIKCLERHQLGDYADCRILVTPASWTQDCSACRTQLNWQNSSFLICTNRILTLTILLAFQENLLVPLVSCSPRCGFKRIGGRLLISWKGYLERELPGSVVMVSRTLASSWTTFLIWSMRTWTELRKSLTLKCPTMTVPSQTRRWANYSGRRSSPVIRVSLLTLCMVNWSPQ